MLKMYIVDEPMQSLVIATSMKTAVGVYLSDVITEEQIAKMGAGDGSYFVSLSLSRVTEGDALEYLNDAGYFDTVDEAQDALQKALHSDEATIYILDDTVLS